MRLKYLKWWFVVLSAEVAAFDVTVARAEGAASCRAITRENLVPCALAASLLVRREQIEGEVRDAKVVAVNPPLPSNPVLSGTLAWRRGKGNEPDATNWTASLAQELEIGGQLGARTRAAENEVLAQKWRTVATERDAAAIAWLAYFDTLAARDEVNLTERLEQSGAFMATAARARADKGLLSEVDADVAEFVLLRVRQSRIRAAARLKSSHALLAIITGGDPLLTPTPLSGDLIPLSGGDALSQKTIDRIKQEHPEARALRAEELAFGAQASAFRRARIPNLTISVFAQNDGYNERVYGVGLALPIPLPGLGRTYSGQIMEAEAQARRTSVERERIERDVSLELVHASQDLETTKQELVLFTEDRAARAERSLGDIAKEIEGGRLSIRDAVVAQDRLVDLLKARLDAKHAVCVASVRLARAAGIPLERGEK